VAVAALGVGVGASLLGSAAASQHPSGTVTNQPAGQRALLRPLRRAVHAEAIVPVAGGRFVTVTLDRGVVQSVSGSQLTLSEGTRKATYRTVTLTIPANATVRDNRVPSQLSSIKPGQVAIVVQGPKHTRVVAHDRLAGGAGQGTTAPSSQG
jgi:hypothetical protein